MRVLIWASALQADILALSLRLDRDSETDLLIVAPNPEIYLKEPIAKKRPISCPILAMYASDTWSRAKEFGADVVVVDNHFPDPGLAPRLFVMWHGLGFKARGQRDLDDFYEKVRDATGFDPRSPNPHLMAQCYGEPDYLWRIDNWGMHPDNCRIIGMAYSDLLLNPPYSRKDLQSEYPSIDIVNRKTVLISFTWHYGGIFAYPTKSAGGMARSGMSIHRTRDLEFVRGLFSDIRAAGADIILCLHETHRYDPDLLAGIKAIAREAGNVEIREKKLHPDNLADLVASDVMVSNLSSFITYKYVMGDPTVHLCPTTPGRNSISLAIHRKGRLRSRSLEKNEAVWMTRPGDNGGLTTYDIWQTRMAVRTGLENADCCKKRAADWLERHVYGIDGHTTDRFVEALREFCARPLQRPPKSPLYTARRSLKKAAGRARDIAKSLMRR